MANYIKLRGTSAPTFGIGIQRFTFDTNSLTTDTTWVLPDNASGVLQNDGSGNLSWNTSSSDSTVPYYIAVGQTFTVNEFRQALAVCPITVDGDLVVDGYLIFV